MNELSRAPEAWTRVGAIAAGVALVSVATPLNATLYGGMLIVVFLLSLVHSGTIALALVRPHAAAVLSVLAAGGIMFTAHLGSGAPWPWAVTTMTGQALVIGIIGWRAHWSPGVLTYLASVAVAGIAGAAIRPPHEVNATAVNMVLFASIAGTALAAGIVLRQWQNIRSQLASERRITEQEHTKRVLAEEKTRIARELHDVIAHSMSIINVQATSAPFRHPHTDEPLRQEFDDIAASSRRALAEMRSLLSVLRDDASPADRAPQPVLSRIPELVEQSRAAGVDVRLDGEDALRDEGVSELTGLAAYRIVQEALSNVIRHAPGAPVSVSCTRTDDAIEVLVRNARPAAAATSGEPGHGLTGMAERAASVGGTITLGPTEDGGFQVRAVLPLHRSEAEQPA